MKIKYRSLLFFFGLQAMLLQGCKSDFEYQPVHPEKDPVFTYNTAQPVFTPPTDFSEQSRLFYFGKVWGVLLYHPVHFRQSPRLLFSGSLARIRTAGTPEEFRNHLRALIDSCASDASYTGDSIDFSTYTLAGNDWLHDTVYLDTQISRKLLSIRSAFNRQSASNSLTTQSPIGVISYNDAATGNDGLPSVSERLNGLFQYWNFINYHYVYKRLIDKNWDAVLYESIPFFQSVATREDYCKSIIRLISNLDDNHSIVHPRTLTAAFGTYVPNFRVTRINDTFIVFKSRTSYLPGHGVRVGDIVIAVNGIPIGKLNDSLSAYASGGNALSRQRELNKLLFCSKKARNELQLIRAGQLLQLQTDWYDFQKLNKYERKSERDDEDRIVAKTLGAVKYLHINSLFKENLDRNLDAIRDSKGLILDMRGYPNAQVTPALLNLVIPENRNFFVSVYPDVRHPGLLRYQHNRVPLRILSGAKYAGPIVVLVDEYTQSQAEFMVMAMQLNPRVRVIGNTSAGSDGNVTGFTFPGGIEVKLSGLGIFYTDFTPAQRLGVKIDKHVSRNVQAIQTGSDPWIDSALTYFKTDPR